jgi:hypothetical protein
MTESARDRILNATAHLLVTQGGDAVTIAAVAQTAKISKGGLFYHFASKELLIEGLVQRYIAAFDQLIHTAGTEPGAATRAYVTSAKNNSGPATQAVLALFAAAVLSPKAMESLQDHYHQWQDRLNNDQLPSQVSWTVRLAVDGLWLADTFSLAQPDPTARHEVLDGLDAMIDAALIT